MDDIKRMIDVAAGASDDAVQARVALANEGAVAVPALATSIVANEPPAKWNLAQALLRVHDAEAVPFLLDLLEAEDTRLQSTAYACLGLSEDERVLQPLIQRFMDERRLESEQAWAASALGNLKDKRAVEPLQRRLEQLEKMDELRYRAPVSLAAIIALAKLGDHAFAPVLLDMVGDDNFEVRIPAVAALKHIVAPGLLTVLMQLVLDEEEETEVRWEALEALFLLGLPESLETCVMLRNSTNLVFRDRVRFRLTGLSGVSFVDQNDLDEEEVERWWDANRNAYQPNTCYRLGKPIQISALLPLLSPNNPNWESILREVQIISGDHFGVSLNIQLTNTERERVRNRIRQWTQEKKEKFVEGALYKHGFRRDIRTVH